MPRPAASGIAAILAIGAVAVMYPGFFLGPWPNLDPAVKGWHREIGELQPLLPNSWGNAGRFLGQFGAALMALPLALHRLRQGAMGQRLAMLAALCGFCLFGALSLAQSRWSGELQAVMLLPWVLTTQSIMRSDLSLPLGRYRVPLRSGILMAALLLQIAPQAFAGPKADRGPQANMSCDWSAAAKGLADVKPQTGIVMTELWSGPEILEPTNFSVVGAPYEIAPAIADTRHFEKDGRAAVREILARRHISYVLGCGMARDASGVRSPGSLSRCRASTSTASGEESRNEPLDNVCRHLTSEDGGQYGPRAVRCGADKRSLVAALEAKSKYRERDDTCRPTSGRHRDSGADSAQPVDRYLKAWFGITASPARRIAAPSPSRFSRSIGGMRISPIGWEAMHRAHL